MALNVVKCNSCNIVINEVLAFVHNKIAVMDEQTIVRICDTAFSAEEILVAKKLLFEAIPGEKLKLRKKDEKSRKDLQDIIDYLKKLDALDPEKIPIFVAKELHKLPPVTFDHLDATRILRDILRLQDHLLQMQDEMVAHRKEFVTREYFEQFLQSVPGASSPPKDNFTMLNNINTRRGAGPLQSFEYDSGPMGLNQTVDLEKVLNESVGISPVHAQNKGESSGRVEAGTPVSTKPVDKCVRRTMVSNMSAFGRQFEDGCNESAEPQVQYNSSTKKSLSANKHVLNSSMAEVLKSKKEEKRAADNKDSEWKIVTYKKQTRNRFISKQGKASSEPNSKFRAAETNKIPLFISNISKETTEQDIVEYIRCKTQIEVNLTKVLSKTNRSYDSYLFYVDSFKVSLFLNEEIWPKGICFRKYVVFNKKDSAGAGNGSHNLCQYV